MLKNRILQIVIFIVLAGCIATGLFFYWQYRAKHPETDDAYIKAHIVNVAPQVTGKVAYVAINNHQHVSKGQLLFSIDSRPFEISLQKAEANLAQTKQQVTAAQNAVYSANALVKEREAELINIRKSNSRIQSLVKQKLESKAAGDQSTSDLAVAQSALTAAEKQLAESKAKLGKLGNSNSNVRAAIAEVNQSKLNLSYIKIVAPVAGYIENFTLRRGSSVSAYQSILSIIDSSKFWAEANFKETQLSGIKAGQPAYIKVDMYPKHIFKGIVSKISHGSGSTFSLLPAENGTGNWVKVTQRFPIRIDIKSRFADAPLRVGSSATVTINTTN